MPTYRRYFVAALCLSLLSTLSAPNHATDVYLGLQAHGAGGKALGVGVASFTSSSPGEAMTLAPNLQAILREDLLNEGLFSVTEGGPTPADNKVDSLQWAGLGAQVLVGGEVGLAGDNITLECK